MPALSREEIAKREIGQTNIQPAVAWFLVMAFLGTLIAVPAIQLVHELRTSNRSASRSAHLGAGADTPPERGR